jgi:cation diffusion facilitator CzcD-associated flavoprotein CzcO
VNEVNETVEQHLLDSEVAIPSIAASGGLSGDQTKATNFDVIVIGAGMGGIYAVYRFRERGLSVLALESAAGVGGVWHHNRYPGARVDVDSLDYCYHFSEELFREWKWTERYASQPELERYLNFVVDKFDLRKHILVNNAVTAVRRLVDANQWKIETSAGKHFTSRFVVSAMGNLTAPNEPDFPGLEKFKGEWVSTSRWPQRHVEVKGKRIGVIGTGSSAVQVIPPLAAEAEHLSVFQRTANFVILPRNRPLDPREIEAIADRFDEYRKEIIGSGLAMHVPESRGSVAQYGEEDRQRLMDEQYLAGGHGMAIMFDNAQLDPKVNEVLSEFVRNKIRATVKDPAVAEKLCPHDHGLGNRRPPMADTYYETFNRDNVTLVDLREDPLASITETGIRTASGDHPLDLIVFSIGFRSFTGTLIDADIRNDNGRGITEHWRPSWRSMLGLMTSGFPNLFMVCGTGGIGISANVFAALEQQVDWIADCIAYMDRNGYQTIEADPEGEEAWRELVAKTASNRLMMTRNVTDRIVHTDPETGKHYCVTFLGGFPAYVDYCNKSAANGYEGFILH